MPYKFSHVLFNQLLAIERRSEFTVDKRNVERLFKSTYITSSSAKDDDDNDYHRRHHHPTVTNVVGNKSQLRFTFET